MIAAGIDFKTLTINDLSNPAVIFYWIFFQPFWEVPIIPWVCIVIIGSVVGENLVAALNARQEGDKKVYHRFVHNSVVDGLLLAISGMLTGLKLSKVDFGLNIWQGIQSGSNWFPNGIPEFLIHSSVPNILYSMGMSLLLLAASFYFCEIRGFKGKYVQFFVFFGRFSLTLFVLHPIFLIGTKDKLDPIGLFILTFVAIGGLGLLLYIWRYRWNAVGTLEWLMIAAGGLKKSKKKAEEAERLKEESEEHHFWFKLKPKLLDKKEKNEQNTEK
jgi:hypothetical protein